MPASSPSACRRPRHLEAPVTSPRGTLVGFLPSPPGHRSHLSFFCSPTSHPSSWATGPGKAARRKLTRRFQSSSAALLPDHPPPLSLPPLLFLLRRHSGRPSLRSPKMLLQFRSSRVLKFWIISQKWIRQNFFCLFQWVRLDSEFKMGKKNFG